MANPMTENVTSPFPHTYTKKYWIPPTHTHIHTLIVVSWLVLCSQMMFHNLYKWTTFWYTCFMIFLSRNWETQLEGLLMTCLIWKIKWKHYGQAHFCLIFVNHQHLIDCKFIVLDNLWLWLFLIIVYVWNLFCT